MSRVTVEVDIDASPKEVWEVVADPRNLPRWDRHITRVTGVPSDGLAPGTTYTTELNFWGVRAKIEAEVVEIEEAKRSKIRLSGLLDATVKTRLKPIGKGRTRLRHDIDYTLRGGPLGAIAEQALDFSGGAAYVLRRGTLRQKSQIESG